MIREDWWSDLSSEEQEEYMSKHPGSKKALERDKKERGERKSKVKNLPGVDKPIDKNPDRVKQVQSIAVEHQVDEYLAGILYASEK